MIGAVWGSGVDVGGDQATIAANKRWQSKLITTSGTFTVPSDVGVIWVDGCSPGEGGAGGHNANTGGGGCGGGPGQGVLQLPLAVTPGDTLTFAIGAGGIGGAAGSNGSSGGVSTITSTLSGLLLILTSAGQGLKGEVSAGGQFSWNGAGNTLTTSLHNPSAKITTAPGGYSCSNRFMASCQSPGVGGAPAVNGEYSGPFGRILGSVENNGKVFIVGGTATATLGGGGGGGHSQWGTGGAGGAGGAVGANATGYGAGGGGGGGNAAGGNGAPSMFRIYAFSATTI